MKIHRSLFALVAVALALSGTQLAAPSPELINYQGVLRDDQNAPVSGSYDMVFAFYDSDGGAPPCPAAGGLLLLTDSHVGAQAVAVDQGLFNVHLGAGEVEAGSVSTLAEAFGEYDPVYAEVRVGGETLCPRIRMVSAAYALNSTRLEGKSASEFLDISATAQTKAGALTVEGLLESTSGGIRFPDGTVQTTATSALPPDECFDNVGRFVKCGDGTVKDTLTGLVWLEEADCFPDSADWATASVLAAQLGDGQCGLTDGSRPGDWRLPTRDEWDEILSQAVTNGCSAPFIPDTHGLGCWDEGDPFSGVHSLSHWSSTTLVNFPDAVVVAVLGSGALSSRGKAGVGPGWPVRVGR